VGERER
jgi:hypothetical protein